MKKELFKKGNGWLRIDLHLHTQADEKFKYSGDNFIKDYVDALQQANISIAAITNHNKFDLQEFKELQTEAEKREIWLLPGVELEINEGKRGIHILIVFNPEDLKNNENFINNFINRQIDLQTKAPNKKLDDVLKDLEELKKDCILIFAHVSNTKGFLKELQPANYINWIKKGFFREKILALQDINSSGKNQFEGELKKEFSDDWLKHKPAYVLFIDPENLEDITSKDKKTYIKIGDFNFQALKFAFLNHEIRIKQDLSEEYYPQILSLEIKNGNFLNNITLNFNSSLNTLIGIRGSGKSSIIEVLRWVVGKEPLKSSDEDYKNSLVNYVLGNAGKVILRVKTKDEFIYTIERNYTDFNPRILDKEGRTLNIKNMQDIFDFVYFGQKDLSKISEKSSDQLKLIDEFIIKEIKPLNSEYNKKLDEIKTLILEIQNIESENIKIGDLESEKTALEEKIKIFKQKGVDVLLKKQTEFETEKEKFSFVISTIKEIEEAVRGLKENEQSFEMIQAYNFNTLENLKQKITKLEESYKKSVNKLLESFNEFYKAIEEEKNFLENYEKDLQKELEKAKKEIDPSLDATFYIKAQKKIEQLNLKIDKQRKRKSILTEKLIRLDDLYHQLLDIQKDIYTKRKEFAENITKKINFIKMNIEFKGDKELFFEKLQSFLQGTGIRKNKIEELVKKFSDGYSIYKVIRDNEKVLKELIGEQDFYKLKQSVEEKLREFITFTAPDKVTIEYKVNEKEFKELKKLSIGQRSASILSIILISQNKPVIIDQPEDDIDNSTIYEGIIKTLLEKKDKNQYIFATHNSNIVVLCDSDNVIVCENDSNNLKIQSGSIDDKKIQNNIVNIMEGGKEAFERRKIIYKIWR